MFLTFSLFLCFLEFLGKSRRFETKGCLMRKSKLSSSLGVIGGVNQEQGIVPPAAAAAAHVNMPENDVFLQKVLSDDEIAALKYHRMKESPSRVKQHKHREQVERDIRRSNIRKHNERRGKQAKSALGRVREGEAFKLGRAAPLTDQEESELLGKTFDLRGSPTSEELGEIEDQINKTVDSEIAGQIEAAKPRNAGTLPTNPAGEPGGVSLVSNTVGTNLRAQTPPRKRSKNKNVPKAPALEEIGSPTEKDTK